MAQTGNLIPPSAAGPAGYSAKDALKPMRDALASKTKKSLSSIGAGKPSPRFVGGQRQKTPIPIQSTPSLPIPTDK